MRLTEARECFLFVCVSVLFCLDEGVLVVPGHSKESMSGGQTNINVSLRTDLRRQQPPRISSKYPVQFLSLSVQNEPQGADFGHFYGFG